jgi:hypothetical protein
MPLACDFSMQSVAKNFTTRQTIGSWEITFRLVCQPLPSRDDFLTAARTALLHHAVL